MPTEQSPLPAHFQLIRSSIESIPQKRMACTGQMDPDLMGPARFRTGFDESKIRSRGKGPKIGPGRGAATGHGDGATSRTGFQMILHPKGSGRHSGNQSEIDFLQGVLRKLVGQSTIRLLGQGEQKDSGGIGVEPMQQDRRSIAPFPAQQGRNDIQGIATTGNGGMTGKTGRFGNRQQVLVAKQNRAIRRGRL